MASEKNQHLEELRSKVKELKKTRDDLNAKLRSKRDSVMGLYGEIDKLLKEARQFKETRDDANKKVSECKKERDGANKKIADLNKKLGSVKGQSTGTTVSRRDYEKLKSDYERLNWKMQTSPMSKQKEEAAVRQIDELEGKIKEYEAAAPASKEAGKLEKELREVRKGADARHKELLKNSETGETAHEQMHEIYKKVDARREKAKKAEEEFLEVKKEVDESHNRFIETLNDLRTEEEKLGIAKARERKIEVEKLKKDQEAKETDLLSELKKGGVIKTEDLLFLQEIEDSHRNRHDRE